MTREWVSIGLLAAFPSACSAAFEYVPSSARSLAMAGVHSTLEGPFSLQGNPAGLASNRAVTAGVYGTRLFGEGDLLLACVEMDGPGLGFSTGTFGGSVYRETVMEAGFALRSENLALGASAKAMFLSIQGYGSDITIGIDVGAIASPSTSVSLGVSAGNVNLPAIGSSRDQVPQAMRAGLAVRPSDGVTVCADLAREGGSSTDILLGAEVALSRELVLRTGFDPGLSTCSLGFALLCGRLSVEYSAVTHDPLGLTQATAICYTVLRR